MIVAPPLPQGRDIVSCIDSILSRQPEDDPQTRSVIIPWYDFGNTLGCNQYVCLEERIPDAGIDRQLSVFVAGTAGKFLVFQARMPLSDHNMTFLDGTVYRPGLWLCELLREALMGYAETYGGDPEDYWVEDYR